MSRLAALLIGALAVPGLAPAKNTKKVIVIRANANLDQEVLFVSGSGFTSEMRVWLLGLGELAVLSVTPHLIEAHLPAGVAPGTYRLVVSSRRHADERDAGARADTLDVTLGAVGPEGEPGAPGPPGRPGEPGPEGPRGAGWTSGRGVPDPSVGRDDDLYLDVETGDVFRKRSGLWRLVANLKGPEGEPGPGGNTSDPMAALAARLGVVRSEIAVPVDAAPPARCENGDFASFRRGGASIGRVHGVLGDETLNAPYAFRILLRAEPGLEASSFVNGSGELVISTAGGTLAPRGIVSAFSTLGAEGGDTLYLLTLESPLAKGRQASAFDVFVDQSPSDIMNRVLSDLGIAASVSAIATVNDGYEVQHNESDLSFLRRLAEESGAFLYTRDDGTVVVAVDNRGFDTGPTLVYPGPFVDPGDLAAFVSSVSNGEGSIPRDVTVAGWDYIAKERVEGTSTSSDGLGASARFDTLHTTSASAQRAAQNLLARARVEASARTGTSSSPSLRAGRTVTVDGAGTDARFSGTFYVTAAQHVLYPDGEDGCFAYGNRFTAAPVDVPFSPARTTPMPRITGLQSGTVMDRQDPDGLGRVKVTFPWTDAGVESNWARIVFPTGGADGFLLPEVDDEVLVGFIGGDPRAPVVLGSLFNGVDKPPSP